MRKGLLTLFYLVVSHVIIFAQKNDYTWLTGYASFGGEDTSCQCWFAITKFDFNQTPFSITHDSLGISFYRANSIVSDDNGSLVLYSNGVQVRNVNDEILQNGDSLGWGPNFTYINPADYVYGMPYSQWSMILPNPLLANVYDMFYIYLDTLSAVLYNPNKLLRARIDMNLNHGLGAVTQKDIPVINEPLDVTISAVRHGNGRDWWLCTNQTSTNCHDILLYTGSDTLSSFTQCEGSISPYGDLHSCRFSPNGALYVTTNDSGQVNIFNFDRCNGVMSLKEKFIIPEIGQNYQWWPTGIEFSSNGRFLYIFCTYRIFQYDLTSSPIVSSKDTIAMYSYPGHYPSSYYWGQLAPDGKIYVNSRSGSYYLSVIDSPDEKGSGCRFNDQNMHIPSYTNGLPYNPNYRLGSLTQSQCDSLSVSSQEIRDTKEKFLNVFPNPATDMVTVDYGFTDWNKGTVSLQIRDALGKVAYSQGLPMYSGFQKIDISQFASGLYTVFIKRNNEIVAMQKLVKQ